MALWLLSSRIRAARWSDGFSKASVAPRSLTGLKLEFISFTPTQLSHWLNADNGTPRQFAATQHFGRVRGETDIDCPEPSQRDQSIDLDRAQGCRVTRKAITQARLLAGLAADDDARAWNPGMTCQGCRPSTDPSLNEHGLITCPFSPAMRTRIFLRSAAKNGDRAATSCGLGPSR